ncbi:hypothetical protein LOD99_3770 [Oopsacas minuta]|uniref:Tr-type G domain-containing protein n=1 Tax=Oopsacas minuta TaxID=111878 RepID=A0AAV7JY52_9METZ|nr:hypothetical protein LOD99_3770 [Oopsacas minuta]
MLQTNKLAQFYQIIIFRRLLSIAKINQEIKKSSKLNLIETHKLLRPPIVSVMGHVDHGKTTLLDSLRNTNVAENEPGLITQHVSSFVVNFEGRDVTFIDTPGHAAFAGIRGRGAKINDITILVVDTNEGIKPQTQEVIDLILKYEIPTIVALNKIDRKTSKLEATEEELVDAGIELENYGGSVMSVPISGLKRLNLDKLVRCILKLADRLELHSLEDFQLKGRILEVNTQFSRGTVATVLVERGLLKLGSILQSDLTWCKVKQFQATEGFDHSLFVNGGKPGYPFRVIGWKSPPTPGAIFKEISSEKMAKLSIKQLQTLEKTEKSLNVKDSSEKEKITRKFADDSKTLYLVVKADTAGSLEALLNLLTSGKLEEVKIEIVRSEVGAILQSDLIYADSIRAHVIGFNVKLDEDLKVLQKNLKIPVFVHNIVYGIVDYVKNELEDLLEPVYEERIVGEANILKLFKIPNNLQASGGIVISGRIERSGKFRVFRRNDLIFEGKVKVLQHKKTVIQKIEKGNEFGVSFTDFNNCLEDDRIFCYQNFPVRKSLVWDIAGESN